MAIRKFRKQMKVITVIITVAFIVSSLALYVMNHITYSSTKNYALKINGNKIKIEDVLRSKNMISNNFKNEIDEDIVGTLALDQVIENELVQEMADSLKIKISSKDINNEYNNLESNFKDKEQFKRMLTAQGYTKASLKKELERSMKSIKLKETIGGNISVTDEEIEEFYEENKFTMLQGLSLEESKEQIRGYLKEEKAGELYQKEITKLKEKMVITDVDPQFTNYLEKTKVEKEGITFTNVDYNKIYITFISNGVPKDKALEETDRFIDTQIKILKKAEEYQVKLEEGLPISLQVKEAYDGIYNVIEKKITPTQEELNSYFEKNRARYDIQPSADAYISFVKIEPSDLDKANSEKKAKEILVTVTPENFASIAKEKSDCPSSANGGELGWFTKEQMVSEFSEAAFKGEAGKIYPEVVNTVFGSHIIYVQEKDGDKVKASHILVKNEISQETIASKLKEVQEQAEKISNGELTFGDLPLDKYLNTNLFNGITDQGYIPGLGYKENLTNEIYKAPLNKVVAKNLDGEIFLFQKVNEIKPRKVDLSEVKENVERDYKAQKATEKIQEVLK